MRFEITEEEHNKIAEWLNKEVYPKYGDKSPYTGAIGGALTYQFTPTSLGVVFKVIYELGPDHRYELDLSDYESW